MSGSTDRCKPVYPPLFQSGDTKINYSKYGKKVGHIQGRISMKRLVRDSTKKNTSLSTCLPDMTTLACTVLQQSLTKNFIIQNIERKKTGEIQRRISISRLVCNLTIQFIIINLHTKYDTLACTVNQNI